MIVCSDSRTVTSDTQSESFPALTPTINFAVRTTAITAGALDITVQWSVDGQTWAAFSTPDAFSQITTTGMVFLASVPARAPFFRLDYNVTTGPATIKLVGVGFN